MDRKVLWAVAVLILHFAPSEAIIGGEDVERNEFPWHVLLEMEGESGKVYCSGSLIELDLVLTTATCVMNSSNINVIAGSPYFSFSQPDENRQTLNSEEIILHESFNASGNQNDIAIIRLSQKFTKTDSVSTINLPPVDYDPELSGNGTIAGWGRKNVTIDKISEYLLKSTVSIRSAPFCPMVGITVPSGQFCTFGKVGGYIGDEGGALICREFPNAICGVLSSVVFDPKNTGNRSADVVGALIEVSRYAEWINVHIITDPPSSSTTSKSTTPNLSTNPTKITTQAPTRTTTRFSGGFPSKSGKHGIPIVYPIILLILGVLIILVSLVLLYRLCSLRRHARLRESVVDFTPEFDVKPYTISGGDRATFVDEIDA
ncbi:unnamed protein product [Orchesella dallaii]|uniref:Peptidase S1 domain-containing protein n=1 Tax=Orchesella dallaii TaxID=48710 RepID=A0ABP1RQ09_9HEXA